MNCKPLFILLAALYLTGCAAYSTAPDDGLTREQRIRAAQVKLHGDTPDVHRFVDLLMKVLNQQLMNDDELMDWVRLAYRYQSDEQKKAFLEAMKEIMDVPPELRSEWQLGKYEMPTKEEREKRLKIIKDWYDEFARLVESTENNHVSTNEFKDSYVECMDAMVSLLSPKYQQRLDEIEASADPLFPNYILRLSEIEMSEELTQDEIDGITAELQAIREELGIPVDDFIQDAAEELYTWMLFKNIPFVH